MSAVPVVVPGDMPDARIANADSAKAVLSVNAVEVVERVIRERRTEKVLAEEPLEARTDREAVQAIVASAGWAPFHRKVSPVYQEEGELRSVVPWRCHVLDARAARELREWMVGRGEGGPLLRLLAACSALVLVTWLPDVQEGGGADAGVVAGEGAGASGGAFVTPGAEQLFAPTLENMEHIAAASAAVQNMLLSAAARGYRTFWSTSKPMRSADYYDRLGISRREVLLGAIYLAAPDVDGSEVKLGSHGGRRGELGEWVRWV